MRDRVRLLKPLLDAEWSPHVFLAGVVLLSILSNACYDFAKGALGAPAIIVAALLALGALVVVFWVLRLLFVERSELESVAPCRGLIALVWPNSASVWRRACSTLWPVAR